MWIGVGTAAHSAVLGLFFTYLVRAGAHRYGIVAPPRKDRWHQRPKALMGVISFYLSFIIICISFIPSPHRCQPILLSATLLFVTGIIDDCIQLKPYIKLAMQIIAAAITVYGGLDLHWTQHETLNNFITIFWL